MSDLVPRQEEVNEMASKDLQPAEKKEIRAVRPEETTGVPYFSPHVDIYETTDALTIVADMPGVDASQVGIDLKDNVLTLQGRVGKAEIEGFVPLYREYREGNYYRQFILSEIVDQEKINARMSKGVLHLTLPKIDRAKPRKIEVKTG